MPADDGDAEGIIRVDVEERLVTVFSALDGFTATKNENLWMVVPAGTYTDKQIPNRRLVVVGTDDGAFELEGMQQGAAPGFDRWTVTCGLVTTSIRDPFAAKRACQTALNAMGAELARDHRIGMRGPQDLHISRIDGPWFGMDNTVPTAWANFDISATASIRRNQP